MNTHAMSTGAVPMGSAHADAYADAYADAHANAPAAESPALARAAAATHPAATHPAAITERGPEIGVAAFLVLLGALVLFDSARLGTGWADDGPQSGYFPFYIGLMLVGSSGWVLLKALLRIGEDGKAAAGDRVFVEREQLALVMAMLVPAVLYVGGIAVMGLYLSSTALIGWFMRRHGRFGWPLCAAVSVGVPLTFFFIFERWFLVPLPKGPIERLLGF